MRYEAKNMRSKVDPCQSYKQNSSIKGERQCRHNNTSNCRSKDKKGTSKVL